MRKASFIPLFAIGFVLLLAGPAAAVVCTNADKKDGAGNIGDVIVLPDGTVVFIPTNPGGQLAGGFVDVWVEVAPGVLVQVANDVFILDIKRALEAGEFPELPHGAHAAAGCGKGVDDIRVCP